MARTAGQIQAEAELHWSAQRAPFRLWSFLLPVAACGSRQLKPPQYYLQQSDSDARNTIRLTVKRLQLSC